MFSVGNSGMFAGPSDLTMAADRLALRGTRD